jgi:hypothetical protein
MRTIFNAGWQLKKVWFVAVISLASGIALTWLGAWLFRTYGLEPLDGGVLKPLTTRILLGGWFAAAGLAIIAGILLYLYCYVARIEADDAGPGFRVTLATPGRKLIVNPDDVVRVGYSDGISHAGGISVNAPWYSVRLRGRRFPLIVDMQGDFLDEPAVDRLIEGEPPPIIERRPGHKIQGRKRRR